MKETQQMGKVMRQCIASHHVFGLQVQAICSFPLDRAKAGMKIYLTDKEKFILIPLLQLRMWH